MQQTAWLNPTVATDDISGGGGAVWNFIDAVLADDGSYAAGAIVPGSGSVIRDSFVRIAPGSLYNGNNKGANADIGNVIFPGGAPTLKTYGGSSDLWGLTLNSVDFNSNFAVGVGFDDGGSIIKVSGFNFNLPSIAFITGVEVRSRNGRTNGPSYTNAIVDSIQVRVTYSTQIRLTTSGTSSAFLYGTTDTVREEQPKSYALKVYKNGQYIGQFKDIANLPSFKNQFNAVPGELQIALARNVDGKVPVVDFIVTEGGNENIITEDDGELLALVDSMYAIGDGTDVDLNLDIELIAYYGGLDNLTTEDDEILLLENDEELLDAYGALDGRIVYTGYISKWAVGYGGDEAVQITVMSYGNDYAQYIYKTPDTTYINNSGVTDGTLPLTGWYKNGLENVGWAQTFTVAGTRKIGRIGIQIDGKYNSVATLELRSGSTIGGGTLLATTNGLVEADSEGEVNFAFGIAPTLTAGTYHFVVTTNYIRNYQSAPYPMHLLTKAGYSGGSLYSQTTDQTGALQPWTNSAGADMAFKVYELGGQTTVPHNSVEPADIFRAAITYLRNQGVNVRFTADSVKNTNTVVSYTFNTNTVMEVLNQVLKLCPADWYWFIEPGTNIVHLEPRPTVASHTFTLGENIELFNIERSLEQLVNDVYFSGGKPDGAETNVFVHRYDAFSSNLYRRRLSKLSDDRVKVESTAVLLADSELARNNMPQYTINLVVVAEKYPIEEVQVGQLIRLANFGNFIDELLLQAASVDYQGDKLALTLGMLPPSLPKRIQDIRRNLDTVSQEDNPVSPT